MVLSKFTKVVLPLCLAIAGVSMLCSIAGCFNHTETVASDSVATGNIFMDVHLLNDGNGEVSVGVKLYRDQLNSNTEIEISDGDELWLSASQGIANLNYSEDLFSHLSWQSGLHLRLDKEDKNNIFTEIV